jgi:hypothetical protein
VLQEPLPSWLRSFVRQRLRKRLQQLQWWLRRQELLCRSVVRKLLQVALLPARPVPLQEVVLQQRLR